MHCKSVYEDYIHFVWRLVCFGFKDLKISLMHLEFIIFFCVL